MDSKTRAISHYSDMARAAMADELLALLIKARRYVGMVTEIPGDDPIFGVMDDIDACIAKAQEILKCPSQDAPSP